MLDLFELKKFYKDKNINYCEKEFGGFCEILSDYKTYLEIGVRYGRSMNSAISMGMDCVGVDRDTTLYQYYKNYKPKLIQCKSEIFWKENLEFYDVVYIDGSHMMANFMLVFCGYVFSKKVLILDDCVPVKNYIGDDSVFLWSLLKMNFQYTQKNDFVVIEKNTKNNEFLKQLNWEYFFIDYEKKNYGIFESVGRKIIHNLDKKF